MTRSLPLGSLQTLHQIFDLDDLGQGNNAFLESQKIQPNGKHTHLVHGNHSIGIDFLARLGRESRIGAVSLRLQPQSLEDLLLDLGISNGRINPLTVIGLDHLDKLLGLLPKLGLGDELAKVNATREALETIDVASSRRTVVLLGLAAVLATTEAGTHGGQHLVDVALLDDLVHIDVVRMQDLGVLEWLQDRLFQHPREERVLIGRLESADARLQAFLLPEEVVHQAELIAGD